MLDIEYILRVGDAARELGQFTAGELHDKSACTVARGITRILDEAGMARQRAIEGRGGLEARKVLVVLVARGDVVRVELDEYRWVDRGG